MNIFIAADHAGFSLKEYLKKESGSEMTDLGTDKPESCDYPVFAQKLSGCVLGNEGSRGILICLTGTGMTIAANRHKGIRAALCFNEKMAELSRRHNDSNVIVFGSAIISEETALNCLRIFLKTEFEGGRHSRRLELTDKGV
jgi:ribose 5-phosphate isomerase B